MKQNWEYKKLGEVAMIEYGTRVVQKKDGGSIYPVYGGGGATFKMDTFNREDRMVIARFAMSKQCTRIVKGKFFLNDSGLTVATSSSLLSQLYLDRCLMSMNDKIYSLGNGAAQKNLDMKAFVRLVIPVPPLSTQTAIVSELDALSAIIADHKSLLKKYDELEQSIFYDMFGDPVKNDKGWVVKTLSEVVDSDCSISYGIVQPGDGELSGVPVVRPVDLIGTYVYPDNLKLTTAEISNQYKRSILKGYEILMCVRGTTGVVSIASNSLKGCNVTRGIVPLAFREYMCTFFMFFQFKSISIKEKIAERTYGATLKQINMKDLRELQVIVPPLPLQQEFASKIEAIEAMKADTKKSLAKSEELFNARMDYYFNA